MSVYQFRAVNLMYAGVATGVNEQGRRVPVIFPLADGGRQRVSVSIILRNIDGAWSAGVVDLRLLNDPNGVLFDPPGGAVQISKPVAFEVLEPVTSTDIVAAYGALVISTANAASAIVDFAINVSDIN